MTNNTKKQRDSVPSYDSRTLFPLQDRGRSTHMGHKTAIKFSRIGCTTGLPHRKKPRGPYLQEKDMPDALHVALYICKRLSFQEKRMLLSSPYGDNEKK